MDRQATQRIRTSFALVAPRADQMVAEFYRRLFERVPETRALFPQDMTRQRAHLLAALATIAKNIDALDVLEEPLMQLGANHIKYGARPEYYPIVQECLIAAIAHACGDQWNPQLDEAWSIALSLVCEAMLRGALRSAIDKATAGGIHVSPPPIFISDDTPTTHGQ